MRKQTAVKTPTSAQAIFAAEIIAEADAGLAADFETLLTGTFKGTAPHRKVASKKARLKTTGPIVLLMDDHEKVEMPFPGHLRIGSSFREVQVQTKRLAAGDCCLRDVPAGCGIEFKRSGMELVNNLDGADAPRATKAFTKFGAAYTLPLLVMEFSPMNLFAAIDKKYELVKRHNGGHARSKTELQSHILWRLSETVVSNGLHLMWGGSKSADLGVRMKMGELLLRLMITHAKGISDVK